MVFAIGGFNGVTTIFNVECYDPQADEWYGPCVGLSPLKSLSYEYIHYADRVDSGKQ